MTVHMSLSGPYRLSSPAALEIVAAAWRQAAPDLAPTRADSREPPRAAFEIARPMEGLKPWSTGSWIGRRARPGVAVTVLSPPHGHSVMAMDVDPKGSTIQDTCLAILLPATGPRVKVLLRATADADGTTLSSGLSDLELAR